MCSAGWGSHTKQNGLREVFARKLRVTVWHGARPRVHVVHVGQDAWEGTWMRAFEQRGVLQDMGLGAAGEPSAIDLGGCGASGTG
eukprot:2447120-Pyramimonas_sp.AAC.1